MTTTQWTLAGQPGTLGFMVTQLLRQHISTSTYIIQIIVNIAITFTDCSKLRRSLEVSLSNNTLTFMCFALCTTISTNVSPHRWDWSRSGSRAAPGRRPSRWLLPGRIAAEGRGPRCQGCCWWPHRPVRRWLPHKSASRGYQAPQVKASSQRTPDHSPFHSFSVVFLESNKDLISRAEVQHLMIRATSG